MVATGLEPVVHVLRQVVPLPCGRSVVFMPDILDTLPDDAPHVPVLASDVVRLAAVQPGDVVIDGTFGAGGHSRLLVAGLGGHGTHVGIDRDPTVVPLYEEFSQGLPPGVTSRLLRMTFPDALDALAREDVSANVVILDVGVSSMHIDEAARGFSYMQDGPLDMRMDPTAGESAAALLTTWDASQLEHALRTYGEEPHARRIARAICDAREHAPIERTAQLVDIIDRAIPARDRHKPGHSARRTFQALRIAVNDELGMLSRGLDAALQVLAPGGRLLVISFHSLEDRMVKRRFAQWRGACTCPPGLPVCACGASALIEPLTRKALAASAGEADANPRAASAKLRAVRKCSSAGSAA